MKNSALAGFLWVLVSPACIAQATPSALSKIENAYADLADASAVLRTIDSGFIEGYQGQDRASWNQRYLEARKSVASGLQEIPRDQLSASDARALSIMRKSLDFDFPPDFSQSVTLQVSGNCSAAPTEQDSSKLREALEACFSEIGDHLPFENSPITRVEAMGRLASLDNPARRKSLFLSLQPLWRSINSHNESDSPYRRYIRAVAAGNTRQGFRIDAAAHTLGIASSDVEPWLEQILDAWRQSTPDQPVEPWDYYYANGQADRALASAIPRDSLLAITQRYYRDLGADLKQLGVLYDLDFRPGKSPIAYMDFVTYGRTLNGKWRSSVVRILADYSTGSLGNLNEFVHENGHAVHGMAVRNRPAFMELGDALFVEAFADVTSWDNFDPAWQKKYLGRAASESDSLRSQYSSVMLDVAWSLFEARMLRQSNADPNTVWAEITSRYLHIVPHPEFSWWAERVQLVDPGYMVNYGLGAVVTAEIRQRTRDAIGPFHTGNPRWYSWISLNLIRSGREHETSDLLRTFLGRPVSPEALLTDIRRIADRSAKPAD